MMLKVLRNYFLTGLLLILPLLISIILLIWGFNQVDAILGRFFPSQIKGVGFVTLMCLIMLAGILAQNFIGKKLIAFGERLLSKIPIINGVYDTTKQIAQSFSNTDKSAFRKVVLVQYPRQGIYSVGFLTGDSPKKASLLAGEELLNVFIPTVPNPTTGFLIFVPVKEVTFLEMSVEDGFRMLISAGVVKVD